MNLLAFAALAGRPTTTAAATASTTCKGLFQRTPFAAVMLGVAMLSLAGIPPFPGFVAKFLIFRNVMAAGYTIYAVLGLVGSYLGIYFYLRVIQFMFMSPDRAVGENRGPRGLAIGATVGCLAAALVTAVFPGWVIAWF